MPTKTKMRLRFLTLACCTFMVITSAHKICTLLSPACPLEVVLAAAVTPQMHPAFKTQRQFTLWYECRPRREDSPLHQGEQRKEAKINTKHFQQLRAKALFSQYSVPFGQHWQHGQRAISTQTHHHLLLCSTGYIQVTVVRSGNRFIAESKDLMVCTFINAWKVINLGRKCFLEKTSDV